MEMTERGSRFLLGLMAILAVLAFYVARPFISYVLLGLITAFLMRGPYRRVLRVTRRPRLAASIMTAVALLFLVLPVIALSVSVSDDVVDMVTFVSEGRVEPMLRDLFGALGIPTRFAEPAFDAVVTALERAASSYANRALPTLFEVFIGLFIYFFLLFFGLLQGRDMVAFVRTAAPLQSPRMDRLLAEVGRAIDAVFRGEILVALIQGTVATAGWWLFGFPNPLLWGSVMTILSIIPWTGAPLVIVPAGLWRIAQGEMAWGVGFIAFGVAVVGMIDNVLRPYIIGRTGEIHPAIVLVGVLGGLATFGLVGLFLGPVVLVLLRAVTVVWLDAAPPAEPA